MSMITDKEWEMRKPEFAEWYAKKMTETFGLCMAKGIAEREVLVDKTIKLDPNSFWELVLEYINKEIA
jgi:hypothetical protein